MLKLILFAPCERHIQSLENLSSLIAVMENINVELGEGLPPEAAIPMKWTVVTLWHREKDYDTPVIYQERVEVIKPDGVSMGSIVLEFEVSNENLNYRSIRDLFGFPIGLQGQVTVRVSLREKGENARWNEVATYPIQVKHHPKKEDGREEPAAQI